MLRVGPNSKESIRVTQAFYIMAMQAGLTFVIFACIARWYIAPALAGRSLRDKLTPLLLVHCFRFVPMMLLLPGQLGPGFPPDLAELIAHGDFVSGVLALCAVLALRWRENIGRGLTWLFTLVGTADMVVVLTRALMAQVWNEPLWFIYVIPTFYVPVLMVTQIMIVVALLRTERTS
jgi:hypothetical protein